MTDTKTEALNRREQRKLAREQNTAPTAAPTEQTPTPAPVAQPAPTATAKTVAVTRREQRKLARDTTATAAAAQEQAVTPEQIKAAQPVQPKPKPTIAPRAEQRRAHVEQAVADGARVPDKTQVDFEAFKSRKPTLHELNQIAKDSARMAAEEARVVGQAAAKAAHGALLGVRGGRPLDPYAAKHAAQSAMDAARATAGTKTE